MNYYTYYTLSWALVDVPLMHDTKRNTMNYKEVTYILCQSFTYVWRYHILLLAKP